MYEVPFSLSLSLKTPDKQHNSNFFIDDNILFYQIGKY